MISITNSVSIRAVLFSQWVLKVCKSLEKLVVFWQRKVTKYLRRIESGAWIYTTSAWKQFLSTSTSFVHLQIIKSSKSPNLFNFCKPKKNKQNCNQNDQSWQIETAAYQLLDQVHAHRWAGLLYRDRNQKSSHEAEQRERRCVRPGGFQKVRDRHESVETVRDQGQSRRFGQIHQQHTALAKRRGPAKANDQQFSSRMLQLRLFPDRQQ